MDFAEAIELSKKFPACHPKIFKGFVEWGVWDTETKGSRARLSCSFGRAFVVRGLCCEDCRRCN